MACMISFQSFLDLVTCILSNPYGSFPCFFPLLPDFPFGRIRVFHQFIIPVCYCQYSFANSGDCSPSWTSISPYIRFSGIPKSSLRNRRKYFRIPASELVTDTFSAAFNPSHQYNISAVLSKPLMLFVFISLAIQLFEPSRLKPSSMKSLGFPIPYASIILLVKHLYKFYGNKTFIYHIKSYIKLLVERGRVELPFQAHEAC